MIFISSDKKDFDTNTVIEWLIYYNKSFRRINKSDNYSIRFKEEGIYFIFNEKECLNINDISCFWYRRGRLKLEHRKVISNNILDQYLGDEEEIINQYIEFITGKTKLNRYSTTYLNKLIVNNLAINLGINVPKTYLLTNKRQLLNLTNKTSIITKGITPSSIFQDNYGKFYMSYTNRITKKVLKEIPNNFFPSLFQEEIIKRYEIRSFYLNDKFWSMAIFSQNNKKTEVDFRKYDDKFPSRNVPFKLPQPIENKLRNLMVKLNLNCGSIDLLVQSNTNDIYFLEINPVGQFGMTSYPCNYNFENEIALFLSNEK